MKLMTSWWLGCFILLATVFVSGVTSADALSWIVGDYPTRPVNQRLHFDRISESLPENHIDARLVGSSPAPGGFMFRIQEDPRILDVNRLDYYNGFWVPTPADLERRVLYTSQYGLQGRAYATAAGVLKLDRHTTFALLRGLTAAALAAMLATIILLIQRCWGTRGALAALSFCAISTGFNLFAPSLYWITFVHVAPAAIISLALLLPAMKRLLWAGAYLLLFLLFTAKFLSGIELFTVTIAAAAIPLFVAFSVGHLTARSLFRQSAAIFAVGGIALGFAMAIYELEHMKAFGSSGLAHLSNRADVWAAQSAKGFVDHLRDFAKVLLVNFVDYKGFGVPNVVPFTIGGYFLLRSFRALVRREWDSERTRVEYAVAAAFLASISWVILQEQHVVYHARYSALLLAYPFGLVLAAGTVRIFELATGRAQSALPLAASGADGSANRLVGGATPPRGALGGAPIDPAGAR